MALVLVTSDERGWQFGEEASEEESEEERRKEKGGPPVEGQNGIPEEGGPEAAGGPETKSRQEGQRNEAHGRPEEEDLIEIGGRNARDAETGAGTDHSPVNALLHSLHWLRGNGGDGLRMVVDGRGRIAGQDSLSAGLREGGSNPPSLFPNARNGLFGGGPRDLPAEAPLSNTIARILSNEPPVAT